MKDLAFRPANLKDLPFLIEAIKAAENMGNGSCTYERLFHLTPVELDAFLCRALTTEGNGYQLSLDTFSVLTQHGGPVACCSSWVEAEDGVSSGFKLSALLCSLLGIEKWLAASIDIKTFAEGAPVRTRGALQLETFYVAPDARGKGLTTQIIGKIFDQWSSGKSGMRIAEIVMLEGNSAALNAYSKAGFQVHIKKRPNTDHFHTLTGNAGFILLHKII